MFHMVPIPRAIGLPLRRNGRKTPPCWATTRRGQSGVGAFASRLERSLPSGPRPTIHGFATHIGLEYARLPMGRVLPPGLCPVRQNVVRFDACSRGVSA
jgi:hypothetical protein